MVCHICKNDPKFMPFCSGVHPDKRKNLGALTAILKKEVEKNGRRSEV